MKTIIQFRPPDLPPSLNGSDGLMRLHWAARRKVKDKFIYLLKMKGLQKIKTPTKLTIHNYCVHQMDWDNLASRAKIVGDTLVSCRYLPDDNPDVIVEFEMKQIKVKRIDDVRIDFIFSTPSVISAPLGSSIDHQIQ